MSYEATIVCDRCGTVIVGAPTARMAREENRHMGGASRSPHDLCLRCVADGNMIPRPATERNTDD